MEELKNIIAVSPGISLKSTQMSSSTGLDESLILRSLKDTLAYNLVEHDLLNSLCS